MKNEDNFGIFMEIIRNTVARGIKMHKLNIKTIPLGPLETNCHVLWTSQQCWLVDVGWSSPKLMDFLRSENLTPARALVTHGHGDHIGGLAEVKREFPGMIITCPSADKHMLTDPHANLSAGLMLNIVSPQADEIINPGDVLKMGELEWTVLDTSGHTAGGVSFYCEAEKVVAVGDALFANSVGRTDIPGGSHEQLITNIKTNLLTLPEDTRVLCGHGPDTTIGKEKTGNYYLTH